MSIIEVISKAGDRLKSQGLAKSFVRAEQKKGRYEVTFQTSEEAFRALTKQACGVGSPDLIGVVFWIPADAFPPTAQEKKEGVS